MKRRAGGRCESLRRAPTSPVMSSCEVYMINARDIAILCVGILVAQKPYAFAQQSQPAGTTQQQTAQLMSPGQLDSLVAPIALYPDPILSQILVASTYPLEIVE